MKATALRTGFFCAIALIAGLTACAQEDTSSTGSTASKADSVASADAGESSVADTASKAASGEDSEAAVTDETGDTKPAEEENITTTEAQTCPPVDSAAQITSVAGAWYVDEPDVESTAFDCVLMYPDGTYASYDGMGKQTSTGEVDFDAEANCYGLYKGDEQLALFYPEPDGSTLRFGSTDGVAYKLFDVADAEAAMVGKWTNQKKDARDASLEIEKDGKFKQLDAAGKVLKSGTIAYDGKTVCGSFRFAYGTGEKDAFTLIYDSATKMSDGNGGGYTKAE